MKKKNEENKLVLVAKETGLEMSKVDILLSKFGGYFQEAKKITQGAKEIIVSDFEDVETMQQAREKRLQLRGVRIDVEKTRKELKKQSLREGKAIDGIANVIKALIEPTEEYLLKQENFTKILQKVKYDKEELERIAKLSSYVENIEDYDLYPTRMSKATFSQLLNASKLAYEAEAKAKKETEKKVEEERLAKLESEREYRRRIIKENKRLIEEALLQEKKEEVKRKKEAKKLAIERKQRLELEKKLEAKAEAEEETRRQARIKEQAEEETRRQSILAPDKDKIFDFANELDKIEYPMLKSKVAIKLILQTKEEISRIAKVLRTKAKEL